MKQNRTIWLVVIGLVLLIVLAYLLNSDRHDWRVSYARGSQEPYGTHLIAELLSEYFPGEPYTILQDSFEASLPLSGGDSARANFVFVGGAMYLRSSDLRRLLDFVENGNQAIIAANVLPYDLMFELYFEECDSIWWDGLASTYDTLVRANFTHPNLKEPQGFPYRFYERNEPVPFEWQYFEGHYFCDLTEGLVPIGTINDSLTNFVQRPYGRGNFYLHSTPLVFTNYHLLDERKLNYVAKVFSHLQEGPIYWDDYSRISERVAQAINNRSGVNNRLLSAESPLQFILSKPPLTWAWYLLLIAAGLYMLFLSRRRQRIIPVVRKNTNTSLEFLHTIGHLYFLQNNHKQLALQKMQYFRNFVRDKYHLQALELDEDFRQKLAQRAAIGKPVIDKIVSMHSNIKNASLVTENTLIDFHQAIDQFYRHCK